VINKRLSDHTKKTVNPTNIVRLIGVFSGYSDEKTEKKISDNQL
jgi:hypothetical protein